MKRIFSLAVLTACCLVFVTEANSQEPPPAPSEALPPQRSAADAVNALARRLSLSEDQKAKILPIIVERRQKIQEVWNSSTLFVRQKQVQVRGINEDSDRRIIALLNGDQQKAYAALEQERKVKRRLRRAESEAAPSEPTPN